MSIKTSKVGSWITLLAACVVFGAFQSQPAYSQQNADGTLNIVYRLGSGKLAPESGVTARKLVRKSREQGAVTMWITVHYEFPTVYESMSPAQVAKSKQEVGKIFRRILGPLVRRGEVRFPDGELKVGVNGCKIITSARGLRRLFRDRRILHYVETVS